MNRDRFVRRCKNIRRHYSGAGLAVLLAIAALGNSTVADAASSKCVMHMTVEVTPDVPDVRDDGFLSSLLSNYADYRLTLRQESDDSTIILELTGPGPEDRCQEVIEAIRKDARVVSVQLVG